MINILEAAQHIVKTKTMAEIRQHAHGGLWAVSPVPGRPGYVGIYAGPNGYPVASTGFTETSDSPALYDAILICAMVNSFAHLEEQEGVLRDRLQAIVHMVETDRDERDETLARIANACVDDYDNPVSRAVLEVISDDARIRPATKLVEAVRVAASVE
ncbi:hypothetical protein [Gordonia sp. N1V]|uniref:hypothetical protein n=1 Tax=Gordonia sp. N1V TaxID=3034163 RepID=UPI0023E2C33E|nr:hypothetical protein [Gordonia sp. N1V]MDF3280877.1 hypothetical protein [Gordonia sp. N1V]